MYDQITLPNGLRVIGEKLTHIHSCSVGCMVQVGSRDELPEENGLSHFIEHMVFKGTKNRSAKQIAEEMDMVGGIMNAFTSKECTCFHAKVTNDQLPLAVDILSDLVLRPTFDAAELEKERNVVLEEIAMCEDTPDDLVTELLVRTHYKGSLASPVLGTEELISAYTREDLERYWKKHYHADHAVVAISGNYDWEAFLGLVKRYFDVFPATGETAQPLEKSVHQPGRIAKNKDIEQVHIAIGYPSTGILDPGRHAVSLLTILLGGGMSSRLFQHIREELGLVYAIYAYGDGFRDIGGFNIYAATSPENAEKVIKAIQSQVELLLKDGFSEKEFMIAKNQLRVGYILSLESSNSRMQSIGSSLLARGFVKQPEEIIAELDAVTPENVMRYAHSILEAPCCVSIVGQNAEDYLKLF